jgi:hypothetical protein
MYSTLWAWGTVGRYIGIVGGYAIILGIGFQVSIMSDDDRARMSIPSGKNVQIAIWPLQVGGVCCYL